jgi:hypothetical protein
MTSLRFTTRRIPALLAVLLFCTVASAQSVYNAAEDYSSIQAAIDAATDNDVLDLSSGIFFLSETLVIDKPLTLRGSSDLLNLTTINLDGVSGYGIHITSAGVSLEHLTVTAGATVTYGIKAAPGSDNLSLLHIEASGSYGTVIDLNGVAGASIDHVSVSGSLNGHGLRMSSCQDITLDHITSAGNIYGDLIVGPADDQYQLEGRGAPSGIHFGADLNLAGPTLLTDSDALAAYLAAAGIAADVEIPTIALSAVLVVNASVEFTSLWNPTVGLAGSDAHVTFEGNFNYAAGAMTLVGHSGWLVTDTSSVMTGLNQLYQLADDEDLVAAVSAFLGFDAALSQLQFNDLSSGEILDYIEGCTDVEACNFSETATVEIAGNCEFPADLYGVDYVDCDSLCMNDINADLICDETQIQGCMNAAALNFNQDADFEMDGDCIFLEANCIPEFSAEIIDTVFVTCAGLLPAAPSAFTATNPCSPGTPVDVISSIVDQDSMSICHESITFRYLALNISAGVMNVAYETHAVRDTTGPSIIYMPAGLTLACVDSLEANFGTAVASEPCHDIESIVYEIDTTWVDSTVAICAGNYMMLRMVTATDVCGNSTEDSYTITVRDEVPPVISNIPADDSLACHLPIPVDLPTVTDACSGDTLVLSEEVIAGDCPQNHVLKRVFTATDGCGNQSTANQHVTFIDTVAPIIASMPVDVELSCEEEVPASAITAADDCSSFEISSLDSTAVMDCPQNVNIFRVHSATDACGNSSSYTQMIEIRDMTAPEFTLLEAFVTASCETATLVQAEATDTCSAVSISMAAYAAIGSQPEGQQLRIYTASDDCGNSIQGIQLVQFEGAENCSGCTSESADNFDATALLDDGSCVTGSLVNEAGDCINDADNDGVCDALEIMGCQDPYACNYIAEATDEGACNYPANELLDCAGNCLDDADEDGVCDDDEVEGCQVSDACNYNPAATDAASCDYSCEGCTYVDATNFSADSAMDDGSCEFASSCEGDINMDGAVGVGDLLMLLDSFASYCDE